MSDTDTDAGPTEGPWKNGDQPGQICRIRTTQRQNEHGVDIQVAKVSRRLPDPEVKANARLIAAAGSAAHEAKEWEMGVDPIGMIEEAPDMLLALDRITYALLNDSAITQGDDEEYLRQIREKIDALQKARRDDASQ